MRVLKLLQIIALVVGIQSMGMSQTFYNADYRFNIEGLKSGENVRLAYYYGDKQYIKEEEKVQTDGVITFNIDTLNTGLALIVFEDNSYFEFVAHDARIELKTKKNDPYGFMEVVNSTENEYFFDYFKFNLSAQAEFKAVNEDDNLDDLQRQQKHNEIDRKVKNKQKELVTNYPKSFVSTLIKAHQEYQPRVAPSSFNEQQADAFKFYDYRKHYFDNLDFSKNTLLYSSVLHQKLETYINQLTVQAPDSLIVSADYLLELASKNKEVFKYTLIYLVNKFAKSKIVCQDKVYVHIVDNYYLAGKAVWISEEGLKPMRENANNLRNNLCGRFAVNFELPDANGNMQSLYTQAAPWTILVFLQTDCSNCSKVIDELLKIDRSKTGPVKIVTVTKADDFGKWESQIINKGTSDWLHLNNKNDGMNWLTNYNVKNWPLIYLLDRDKRIELKRIDTDQIEEYILSSKSK